MVTVNQPANGAISPAGPVTVNDGGGTTFTVTPSPHYQVTDILVGGSSVMGGASGPAGDGSYTYTLNGVTADRTISAVCTIIANSITATAGAGGTISPSGAVSVNYGTDQTFTITPSGGNQVKGVLVDGSSVGAVTTYKFPNVTAPHTISATFDTTPPTSTLTVTGTAGNNGWLKGPATLTMGATDPDDSSASLTSLYRLDGVDPAPYAVYSSPVQVSADGAHTVDYYSKDPSGVKEAPRTTTVKIDKTGPAITITTPQPGAYYKVGTSVTWSATATDAASGPATQTLSGSLNTATTGSKTLTVTATDNAGNQTTATVSYTVGTAADTTPPTITLDPSLFDGQSLFVGQPLAVLFSVTDSGPAGTSISLWSVKVVHPDGTQQTWSTTTTPALTVSGTSGATTGIDASLDSKDGQYTVTITAKDNAGNSSTQVVHYVSAGNCGQGLLGVLGGTATPLPLGTPPTVNIDATPTIPLKFSLKGDVASASGGSLYLKSLNPILYVVDTVTGKLVYTAPTPFTWQASDNSWNYSWNTKSICVPCGGRVYELIVVLCDPQGRPKFTTTCGTSSSSTDLTAVTGTTSSAQAAVLAADVQTAAKPVKVVRHHVRAVAVSRHAKARAKRAATAPQLASTPQPMLGATAAPTVTSFTPTSGVVGTTVTVTGTTFTGATTVTFNYGGTPAATATPTSVTATTLKAVVPAGAVTGPIAVTTAAGTGKSSTNFSVTPTITSFTPTSAGLGMTVTITGTGLTGATKVTFNGTAATKFTVVSSTSVTATVPTGATTGKIAVTTAGGTATSTATFTLVATPTITSFTPTSGAGGTSVVVTGTNLTGATAVTFNGAAAQTITVNSATQITATVPPAATTGTIAVTTPGGNATSAASFTTIPSITSIATNPIVVGNSETISGTTFGPTGTGGVLTLSFFEADNTPNSWNTNQTPSPITSWGVGKIVFTTPNTFYGSTNCTVTAGGKTSTSTTLNLDGGTLTGSIRLIHGGG